MEFKITGLNVPITDSFSVSHISDHQGFFSKFLMGGTQNCRSPTGTKSDGGDLRKKI